MIGDVIRHVLLPALCILTAAGLPAQAIRALDVRSGARFEQSAAVRSNINASPAAASGSLQDQVVARVLCGDGWETVVVLFNTGTAPLAFRQFFLDAEGKPMPLSFRVYPDEQTATAAEAAGVLNPGSSLSMTLSAAEGFREGWSAIASADTRRALTGYAVIRRQARNGTFHFEANIPLSTMQDYSVYMRFDNTQGFRTELTLLNPATNLGADARLTYFSFSGEVLLIDSLSLKAGQQTTIVVPDIYPDLANKIGTVLVEANINRFSAVALRVNPSSGAVASLPALVSSSQ
jgi:hypothetical protein